ncbi:DMT family transporter [Frigidibacter oleivorans]|uniref:DMT family transporter n=1 Tax=Frigidibacter oleivorans TaxID=2487129 RepID=UPI000F8DF407|nr:DMT family transporter [Frigidibacter oleivorans]
MQPLRGIVLKIASVLVFVSMASIVKLISDDVPPGEIVFFRSAFAVPVILVWLIATGDIRSGIATARPLSHLWRALAGTVAMGFAFAALGLLPLPEATAIGYAAPLLTVIFAAMFLGEEVRLFRIATVALGLVGVLIVLSPRLGSFGEGGMAPVEATGAMMALVGAVFAALAQVFIRGMVHQERTSAIVFWFSVNGALLSLVTLPWGWVLPSPGTAALLVLAGTCGGIGQVLLTSAYRFAPASVVAPFEYASMLLALLVGYVAFAEVPTPVVLTGAALIVLAGILIIWREHQLGLERSRQRQSAPPS